MALTVERRGRARDVEERDDIRPPSSLSLYHFDRCPYCIDVRRELASLGIDVELRNIHEREEHRATLVDATGRPTVPVLRVERADGSTTWLPESLDIIDYLRRLRPGTPRPPLTLIRLRRLTPLLACLLSAVSPRPLALALLALAALSFAWRYRTPRG